VVLGRADTVSSGTNATENPVREQLINPGTDGVDNTTERSERVVLRSAGRSRGGENVDRQKSVQVG
jgi:hypothetical protein